MGLRLGEKIYISMSFVPFTFFCFNGRFSSGTETVLDWLDLAGLCPSISLIKWFLALIAISEICTVHEYVHERTHLASHVLVALLRIDHLPVDHVWLHLERFADLLLALVADVPEAARAPRVRIHHYRRFENFPEFREVFPERSWRR